MISDLVNLSTGPVNISPEVRRAFSLPPVSHRSPEFVKLFEDTCGLLSSIFAVRHSFILSGSGTLANETMLYQIKALELPGLILSNGEFGSRLMNQAERLNLDFRQYTIGWGQQFDVAAIREVIQEAGNVKWVLFCHCETSTGVVNDLQAISSLCVEEECFCFVDCISSVGNVPFQLSNVSMATASSGKGLASYSGLALILSNIEPASHKQLPVYVDLGYYASKERVPFTISSNLVRALYVAVLQKTDQHQLGLINEYCSRYHNLLSNYGIVPFSSRSSKVFTIVLPKDRSQAFINEMMEKQVVISHESGYLKSRCWSQLAVFGCYSPSNLEYAYASLAKTLQTVL